MKYDVIVVGGGPAGLVKENGHHPYHNYKSENY